MNGLQIGGPAGTVSNISIADGASGAVSVTITASSPGYASETVTETKTITALQ
jgi:hypothetical protein